MVPLGSIAGGVSNPTARPPALRGLMFGDNAVAGNGAIKRRVDNQPGSRLRRNSHYCGVAGGTSSTVSAHPIVVSRSPVQACHNSSGHVADVQVVVTIHVTAERVARGNIQHVTERTVHTGPTCHKGAAGRCRNFNFTLCRHFGGAWKTGG